MNRIFFSLTVLFVLMTACQAPQESQHSVSDQAPQPGMDQLTDSQISVAFYNVENLFDTQDNPDRLDEDFLPDGRYQWTPEKYQVKLRNTARVLKALQADVIGLAEVENSQVLQDLVDHELLQEYGYRFVHEESPDDRGIDVALLYRPAAFAYLDHKALRAYFPNEPDYHSRDFLLVEGRVKGGEPLFLVVNHWPSRREGQEASEPRRLLVANLVKAATDSIFSIRKDACILLMGDFNDDPLNRSLTEALAASTNAGQVSDDGFYNPMAALHDPESQGSLTYRGSWNLFDQFVLSENLLLNGNALTYKEGSAAIFHPEWMSIGKMKGPRRSIFKGELDKEGFSDHFPIYLMLEAQP